jgi:hypothetical protein
MPIKFLIVLACLLFSAFSQGGSIQIVPTNPTLLASTTYSVSYYTIYNMPAATTFTLDFTSTSISIPSATLNVTATLNDITQSAATATCANMKCTLKLNVFASATSRIVFQIGNFMNPYFINSQVVQYRIVFNASYNEMAMFTITSSQYNPIKMGVGSYSQSNYGVGNTNVSYTFNLTVPMTPAYPQLAITIPN